jgi:hypothetical protein
MKSFFLIAAAALFAIAQKAGATSFDAETSWVGDVLRIEVQTDAADGTQLNVAISNEQTGNHIVSLSAPQSQKRWFLKQRAMS